MSRSKVQKSTAPILCIDSVSGSGSVSHIRRSMASLNLPTASGNQKMCGREEVVEKVVEVYGKMCKLESLKPSKIVNGLFNQLVGVCTSNVEMEVGMLSTQVQEIRSHLIRICGHAEGLLESHYSMLMGQLARPLSHLRLFPYYANYAKLAATEYAILCRSVSNIGPTIKTRVAFVGSGPMPLTSILLAKHHLKSATFDNYDLDANANSLSRQLVASHPDLSRRMAFHTADILHVTDKLASYDVVLVAALVGMGREEKAAVVSHLGEHMRAGGVVMMRSARGARAFLYPVVDEDDLLRSNFQILSLFHPTDDVINSVLLARKPM